MISDLDKHFSNSDKQTSGLIDEDIETEALDRQWLKDILVACEDIDSNRISELMKVVDGKLFSDVENNLVSEIRNLVEQYDYDDVVLLLRKEMGE